MNKATLAFLALCSLDITFLHAQSTQAQLLLRLQSIAEPGTTNCGVAYPEQDNPDLDKCVALALAERTSFTVVYDTTDGPRPAMRPYYDVTYPYGFLVSSDGQRLVVWQDRKGEYVQRAVADADTLVPGDAVATPKATFDVVVPARLHHSGTVLYQLTVDAGGAVANVDIFQSGPFGAAEQAVDAVMGARFDEPGLLFGSPVGTKFVVRGQWSSWKGTVTVNLCETAEGTN